MKNDENWRSWDWQRNETQLAVVGGSRLNCTFSLEYSWNIFCNLIGQSINPHMVSTYRDHALGYKMADSNFHCSNLLLLAITNSSLVVNIKRIYMLCPTGSTLFTNPGRLVAHTCCTEISIVSSLQVSKSVNPSDSVSRQLCIMQQFDRWRSLHTTRYSYWVNTYTQICTTNTTLSHST